MKAETALDRACRIVGTSSELANRLGLTRAAVSAWRRKGRIPPEYALKIEALTAGRVTRHEIRPDLYPTEGAA